jgi:hypothetical protein
MKSAVWLLMLCMVIIAPVSAYSLYIDAPSEIYVGQALKVTGNSSLPSGTSFEIVLYRAGYTATHIDSATVTLQDSKSKAFVVTFSTKGLTGGQYKIEVQSDTMFEDKLSSDSITMKLVKIADRSGEITFTAPVVQSLDEALRIEGSIKDLGDDGVKIEVRGPDGLIFGPTWVETRNDLKTGEGMYTKKVVVTTPGNYDIQFTDADSYIGMVTVTVAEPTTAPTTAETTQKTPVTTHPTQVPTTIPTTTQSPVSPLIAFAALGIVGVIAVFAIRRKE